MGRPWAGFIDCGRRSHHMVREPPATAYPEVAANRERQLSRNSRDRRRHQ
jgi:hypothetical protein